MAESSILRAFSLFLLAFAASEVFGADTEGDAGSVVVWFPLVIMSHRIYVSRYTAEVGGIGSVSDLFYEFRKIRWIKCSSKVRESTSHALLPIVGFVFPSETIDIL
ncbi:hypothetical protein Tco_0908009 [Tanacetum coccineum]|uniref:Uncharacterized protein n=1 Tax=Tanacetum coccineum TaxID=301880 RepID=A0ABQ5CSB3_9ASTR